MVKWSVKDFEEFKKLAHDETIIRFVNKHDVLNKRSNFLFKDEKLNAENAILNNETKLGMHDVSYYINQYGFRGDWDLRSPKKKVIFFGCSVTLGWGLNEDNTFYKLISKELFPDHEIINISAGGWSIDTIVRFFKYITDIVNDIEYCFFILPSSFRTELPVYDGSLAYTNIVNQKENIPEKYLAKYDAWLELNDDYYEIYRVLKNITYIDHLSRLKGIKSFYSYYDRIIKKYINEVIEEENVLPMFEQYELESRYGYGDHTLKYAFARDGCHPGKYSNEIFAEQVIKKLKNN